MVAATPPLHASIAADSINSNYDLPMESSNFPTDTGSGQSVPAPSATGDAWRPCSPRTAQRRAAHQLKHPTQKFCLTVVEDDDAPNEHTSLTTYAPASLAPGSSSDGNFPINTSIDQAYVHDFVPDDTRYAASQVLIDGIYRVLRARLVAIESGHPSWMDEPGSEDKTRPDQRCSEDATEAYLDLRRTLIQYAMLPHPVQDPVSNTDIVRNLEAMEFVELRRQRAVRRQHSRHRRDTIGDHLMRLPDQVMVEVRHRTSNLPAPGRRLEIMRSGGPENIHGGAVS
jgi:hypothetical protein